MVMPDYYVKFYCIGGECKHNCCRGGWEIEIDDDSVSRFLRIEGEFGARVRAVVSKENTFVGKNGGCPLLLENGLCEMVLRGEELCVVCDEYPRFTEYYGEYAERGLSLSCEAAAKIIIDDDKKVKLAGDGGRCDDEMFGLLMSARKKVFDILQDRSLDIYTRIRLMLDYGDNLQARINDNDFSEFNYIPHDRYSGCKSMKPVFDFIKTLDFIDMNFADCTDKCGETGNATEIQLEQIAVYFAYRYMLKSMYDCDVLSKLKFAAMSTAMIDALLLPYGDIYESARRYSVEIEHSEENLEAIYDEFLFNYDFSVDSLINMIK